MCGTCLSPDSHTPSYLRDNWHLPAQSSYPMAARVWGWGARVWGWGAGGSPPGSMLLELMCPRRLRREQRCSLQKPLSRCPTPSLHCWLIRPPPRTMPTERPSWSSPQALRYPAAPPAALPAAMLSYLKAPGHSHSPVLWKAQLWPPKDVPALTPELVCYLMW